MDRMRWWWVLATGFGVMLGLAACSDSDEKPRPDLGPDASTTVDRGPEASTADRGPDTVPWAPDATTWSYCSGWQVSCRKGNVECCPHPSVGRCPSGWSCMHLDCFSKTGVSCPVGKKCSPYRGCTCVTSTGTCPPCHECRDTCQNFGMCGW